MSESSTLPASDDLAPPGPTLVPAPIPRPYGALAGVVAGAVAVTMGMLVAGIIDVVSPIDAVGSEFIDRVPPWLKEMAIQWFGTNDKLALRAGIVITLAVAAAIVGYLASRHPIAGAIGIGLFGFVGVLAALHRPGESASAASAGPDRHGDRYPTARLAPAPDWSGHRDAWTVASTTRLGSAQVLGFRRVSGCCGGRRRGDRSSARTKAGRGDPRRDPRHTSAGGGGWRHGWLGHRHTRRRNAQSGDAVHHSEQRLLPDRHCAVVPPDQLGELEGRHRRHGREANDDDLRRPLGQASGRADHHPVLRLQRGWRRVHLQRHISRCDAGRPASRGRR